jgi:hypothetical protein
MTDDDAPDDGTRPDAGESLDSSYPTDVLVGPDWVESRLDRFDAEGNDASSPRKPTWM